MEVVGLDAYWTYRVTVVAATMKGRTASITHRITTVQGGTYVHHILFVCTLNLNQIHAFGRKLHIFVDYVFILNLCSVLFIIKKVSRLCIAELWRLQSEF